MLRDGRMVLEGVQHGVHLFEAGKRTLEEGFDDLD
jgi:hypothetical protein